AGGSAREDAGFEHFPNRLSGLRLGKRRFYPQIFADFRRFVLVICDTRSVRESVDEESAWAVTQAFVFWFPVC
ncbi:MAG: hypothetical protein AAB217_08700, partial [Chloroflexota bacterium]